MMVDYSNIYDKYWQNYDRLGESSFSDPRVITKQILCSFGFGRILDVGSGMGVLVRDLLRNGVDAYGVDVSEIATKYCNTFAPGRFTTGSLLSLPFDDESYDTIISTDCLEHLATHDVGQAFSELYRVCRKNLYIRIATRPDRDKKWHLTVKPRAFWEEAAFRAGFRKHPVYYKQLSFPQLEYDGYSVDLYLEKIPYSVLSAYPLDKLLAERDLHMDMLRETGRRSDGHIHRYWIAAKLVRPGDIVLDAACGLGYGSHLLASLTQASKIIGVDNSESAIGYAMDNFIGTDQRQVFRNVDVQNMDFLEDNSVDLVVSFETLEHIPQTQEFLKETARILKPGGRIIVSVPNRWVDDSGKDPNPWHLHVYDWEVLHSQLSAYYWVERAYGQTAGGGMRLTNHVRDFFEFPTKSGPQSDCEWLLGQGILNPLLGKGIPYKELMYPEKEHPKNLIAFDRDYLNPYLVHAMVSLPWRISNPGLLKKLTDEVRDKYPLDTPDFAAAVCIEAYNVLEDQDANPESIQRYLSIIKDIQAYPKPNAHYFRWQISTAYVAGLLACKIGDFEDSISWFKLCANYNCLDFSATLATKTIDAAAWAGRLMLQQGNIQGATQILNRGIDIFFDAFCHGPENILGVSERPFDFPYFELTEIAASVTNCVNLLRTIKGSSSQVVAPVPVENLQAMLKRMASDNELLQRMISDNELLIKSIGDQGNHWIIRFLRTVYRATLKKLFSKVLCTGV